MPHLNVSILLPAAVAPDQARALIEESFETMESTNHSHTAPDIAFDGTAEKRHIILACGFEYEERLEDLDLEGLQASFNLTPASELRVTTTQDTPADHHLLARLCILLADKFAGIIELPTDPFASTPKPNDHPGILAALREFDEGQPYSEDAATFFCDATFLRQFSKDPAFNLNR